MQKKLIAVAVAGLLSAPAFAQTNVTISGTLNAGFENIAAGGGTAVTAPIGGPPGGGESVGSLKSRTRMVDNLSELRFSMEEDLGGGLKAFGTIGSTIDPGNSNVPASTQSGSLGSRNTGVGLRSGKWGEILFGNWDLQWTYPGMVDGAFVKGATATSTLAILHNNGRGGRSVAQGGRYNNQIRYASPNWNGFSFIGAYARHIEQVNSSLSAPGQNNNYNKESTWSITPMYNNGPWTAFYSYMKVNDRGMAAANSGIFGTAGTVDVTGHRAGLGYTFAMGLKIGIIWDRLKSHEQLNVAHITGATSGNTSRTAWAIPVFYTTGPHGFGIAYARAGSINASANSVAANTLVKAGDNNTGAHFWNLSYQYSLSKRTNLWANYSKVTNGSGAAYDFVANGGIGMASGALIGGAVRAANEGADPRTFGVGIRHVF